MRAEQRDSWHGLERVVASGSVGRAQDRVAWHGVLPGVYPVRLRITVPFHNQIRDGFAKACTITVGDQVPPVTVRGSELFVEATIEAPVDNVVTLNTPGARVTPRRARGANDDRQLGLAIAVYPWQLPNL